MFVDETCMLCPYFGIVKFYFTVTAVICQQPKIHHLSYVHWMKFKSENADPLSDLYMVTRNFYQTEFSLHGDSYADVYL